MNGTLEPGGIQSSNKGGNFGVAGRVDTHMMDLQTDLGQMQKHIDRVLKNGAHVENMCIDQLVDSGDSNRAPSQPQLVKSKPISYRDAFVNSEARWENCFRERGLQNSEMEFEEMNADAASEVNTYDGIPSVSLDVDTRKRIIQQWKHCLIEKVVGKTVGFKFMCLKVNELWKPTGKLQILDLGFDFFLFKI